MEKVIQVKGLQKSYQKLHVLKGVDLEVEKGCIFALLGSNGAGKTTIIEILTTLLKQDGGTASVNRFGLAEAADRRVSTYSGGMRRGLDTAMSLVGKPQLIFLDEPNTGLAPEARLEVWKTVKDLAKNGTKVFLTTQYLEEAEQLDDRIAILHEGKIIANDTITEQKRLFPPAEVEYVEKQPTLEETFLAIVGTKQSQTESVVGPQGSVSKKENR